eukprot:scaffold3514_cov241-Prasinococcus_capsulatus_cf.AAC.1
MYVGTFVSTCTAAQATSSCRTLAWDRWEARGAESIAAADIRQLTSGRLYNARPFWLLRGCKALSDTIRLCKSE